MRPWLPILAAAFAAGAAQAQPVGETPPTTTIVCLDVGGQDMPAVCKVPGSRLDPREDICVCPAGGMRTVAPICPKGVRPPPNSAALDRARRPALRSGTLVGLTFDGRPICVAPRLSR